MDSTHTHTHIWTAVYLPFHMTAMTGCSNDQRWSRPAAARALSPESDVSCTSASMCTMVLSTLHGPHPSPKVTGSRVRIGFKLKYQNNSQRKSQISVNIYLETNRLIRKRWWSIKWRKRKTVSNSTKLCGGFLVWQVASVYEKYQISPIFVKALCKIWKLA